MIFALIWRVLIIITPWWNLLQIHWSSSTRRRLVKSCYQLNNFFLLMINHLFKMLNISIVFPFICQHLRIQMLHIWFQLFDGSILFVWNVESRFNGLNKVYWLRTCKFLESINFWLVKFVRHWNVNLFALFAFVIWGVDFGKTWLKKISSSILSFFGFFLFWHNDIRTLCKTKWLFVYLDPNILIVN